MFYLLYYVRFSPKIHNFERHGDSCIEHSHAAGWKSRHKAAQLKELLLCVEGTAALGVRSRTSHRMNSLCCVINMKSEEEEISY